MEAKPNLEDLPDFLTLTEAADVLRISRGLAYEAVRRNQLPALKIGRRLLVPRTALLRLRDALEALP